MLPSYNVMKLYEIPICIDSIDLSHKLNFNFFTFSSYGWITVRYPWILLTLKTLSELRHDSISVPLRFNNSVSTGRRDNKWKIHTKKFPKRIFCDPLISSLNPVMHDVIKWPRFLKYVWPFYNIMHEKVNKAYYEFLFWKSRGVFWILSSI